MWLLRRFVLRVQTLTKKLQQAKYFVASVVTFHHQIYRFRRSWKITLHLSSPLSRFFSKISTIAHKLSFTASFSPNFRCKTVFWMDNGGWWELSTFHPLFFWQDAYGATNLNNFFYMLLLPKRAQTYLTFSTGQRIFLHYPTIINYRLKLSIQITGNESDTHSLIWGHWKYFFNNTR